MVRLQSPLHHKANNASNLLSLTEVHDTSCHSRRCKAPRVSHLVLNDPAQQCVLICRDIIGCACVLPVQSHCAHSTRAFSPCEVA